MELQDSGGVSFTEAGGSTSFLRSTLGVRMCLWLALAHCSREVA